MHLVRTVLLFSLLAPLAVAGQEGGNVLARQLIVQLDAAVDGKRWAGEQAELTAWRRLGQSMNIWLLQVRRGKDASLLADRLRTRDPAVLSVQSNHQVSLRRRPDDPRYAEQWQFENTGQDGLLPGNDHNLEAAWEITTGGLTPNGDTIVIASIDNGIDLDHEDLVDNIWINRDEIPDNDIDDDDNGYVDDVRGWNTSLENGDIESDGGDHGTPVMGQIAARGNNGTGVTGVNWNAKVMSVTNNFNPVESEVIQAYGYVLEARKRYDATGGREGAYVVATNASWGRNRAFPSQSPIWCALYDSLGKYGILNVAAVPNTNIDVERVGDLPALCDSDYLVIVTNVNDRNERVANAAFGSASVDLGAYGEGIYTTELGNGYGEVFGTSFATPAVTGAIGLMYSTPCQSLGELIESDPAAAALYVKQVLLGSVRPVSSLSDITTTGGLLDVGTAVRALVDNCGQCRPPTSLAVDFDDGEAVVNWRATASISATSLRYRREGHTDWTRIDDVASPQRISDLPACSTYEFQLIAECEDEAEVATDILEVVTPGCCRPPTGFRTTALKGARIRASWQPVSAAQSYTLRYRPPGEPWTEITTTETVLEVSELRNCRDYELELRTNCGSDSTDFSRRRLQTTLGCGVCLDVEYCEPAGLDNNQEWIAAVSLPGILQSASGRDETAYRNFGDLTKEAVVRGGVYGIELTSGFMGVGFTEDFHVYVDWDQDGTFSDQELIVQKTATRGVAQASFTVPEGAELGLTRMRVIMQFTAVSSDGCPDGNGRSVGGEVEDYCLDVAEAEGCPPPDSVEIIYSGIDEATRLRWNASAAPGGSYHLRYRERTAGEYREMRVDELMAELPDINLCENYELQIASVCGEEIGDYRAVFLGDDCVGTRQLRLAESSWSVTPNPATSYTLLQWSPEVSAVAVECFSMDGRRIGRTEVSEGDRELRLPTGDLPAGLYTLRLIAGDGRSGSRRLLVQRR